MLTLNAKTYIQTLERLIKTDRDLVFEILPPFRITTLRAPAENLAEKVAKLGSIRTAEVETFETEPTFGPVGRQDAIGIEPVQIIELALLRVAQDVVSFRNPLETLLCMTISWI